MHRTCLVAVVRYVYIVRQNQASAEYFISRCVSHIADHLHNFILAGSHMHCSVMEVNIGVICSCMPALRPFFARLVLRLSFRSLKARMSRYRNHPQNSDQLEDGQILDILEQYQNMDANDGVSTQRSRAGEPIPDMGARNIVAF